MDFNVIISAEFIAFQNDSIDANSSSTNVIPFRLVFNLSNECLGSKVFSRGYLDMSGLAWTLYGDEVLGKIPVVFNQHQIL